MGTVNPETRHVGLGGFVLVLTSAVGVAVGLLESAFGPYYPLLIATAVCVLGVLVRRSQPAWSRLLLAFGSMMALGALMYVVLGLLPHGAPSSGSGTGVG
ncbi:hypothetical protein ACTJJ4_07355 [Microbacterium sp. 22195]|uniref:hypothetical protein n=1 Tax=Microbacterium sp. 22195 TaxID=3453891 RepID=UPI003F82ED09